MPTRWAYVHTRFGGGQADAREIARASCAGKTVWGEPAAQSSTARAVASSVMSPLISRPASAALMAGTFAHPIAAAMVAVSAGTCGGMLVSLRLAPPLI